MPAAADTDTGDESEHGVDSDENYSMLGPVLADHLSKGNRAEFERLHHSRLYTVGDT